jgi:outer membrane protein, multidrug efflux system
MKHSLLAMSILGFLAGCNLAPHYSRPDMALPTTWRTQSDEGSTLANQAWWEALGDPILNGLIQDALSYNNDLQVAIWTVCEYYAQYQVARSGLFPEIDLNAGALKERLPINQNFLPPGLGPVIPDYELNMSLSYELDFWGQIRNTAAAAYSEYLAQIENRRTVVLTLVGSVAQAYIYLRQLDLQLEIARKTLKSREESLEIAKYRFEGGLTSEIEVAQAQSVYEDTLASVKNFERQIPQQENLLSILTGKAPTSIPRGKPLNELVLPLQIPAGLPSDLLARRPDILQAENNLKAANANIGVARAAFFPQINLTGLFGWESIELKKMFNKSSKTWLIGGSLLEKIFTGGKLTGQLNVAKAQKQEMVFHYEQTILTALKEVDDALIGLQKTKEIVVVDQAAVDALKEYLTLSWLRYYEGETQYLTVLDAERQVFSAELTLAQVQGDQFLFLIDLYKALGGGWVIEADAQLKKEKSDPQITSSQETS